MTNITTSTLAPNPNPPDFEDEEFAETDDVVDSAQMPDEPVYSNAPVDPEPEQDGVGAVMTEGNGIGHETALAPIPKRRGRPPRVQTQIPGTEAAAMASESSTEPQPQRQQQRRTKTAEPTPEELQALGWLILQARKQGVAPEIFVSHLRAALAAWDSTQ